MQLDLRISQVELADDFIAARRSERVVLATMSVESGDSVSRDVENVPQMPGSFVLTDRPRDRLDLLSPVITHAATSNRGQSKRSRTRRYHRSAYTGQFAHDLCEHPGKRS